MAGGAGARRDRAAGGAGGARRRWRGPLAVLGALVCLALASTASAGDLWSVALGPLAIRPEERIIGFELRIRSGRIAALPRVPFGWHVVVDNEPSWTTRVTGDIIVGVAALAPDELADVVRVEALAEPGSSLDIEGELLIRTGPDRDRRIPLRLRDLVLTRPRP